MIKNINWSIVGGGNGGQSMAGHLGVKGFPVKLFDVNEEVVKKINEKGGIDVSGIVEGFGKVQMATTNIREVIEDADFIIVVLPSLYHKDIAKACAPHLKDGQIVLLHPGSTFGALEFKKTLMEENCKADVTIGEVNSLLYACRVTEPGKAHIFGIKNYLFAAALPATENKRMLEVLNTAFPQFREAKNVIHTSLENFNAMMHPAPTLLNTSKIDSKEDFLYYHEGITPVIGEYIEKMDKERILIGKALDIDIIPMKKWYVDMYDSTGETLSELCKNTKAYNGIIGQKTLMTRYVLEDIPYSLEAMMSMGKMVGVNVDRMETIVNLGKSILGDDLLSDKRTMSALGFSDFSKEELLNYVENL
ncbi:MULTISPECIES: NAD/NADP octopine/nopaline dehydrogenase family protein [Psychrilyobacter]|uniref:NADP transhydrogenase subunit alpha n=1 Tax=Psychrilyobacter piezotolerans TaxID=2293438 RepID=A0ABX9KGV0_9FUSO|nr:MULTISPECIES: NAD/NADP-dependent octopine/nopaline dehydrogenase family protein [Psychrilyobacter]MCS5423104.1 NAD/NADP octopine/nopaline dehydrogenase family protein [Psychrilyobacter sp. S5]NDI78029.1 NADP transhydrogenase subunit alpha [Psychrilyobacter piezotolerans]RDE61967.1 NADP transhydrogenase subunit alpha [Psychrilyobacter sp. S5]REI41193.1 NADP transhydrogenase subunit alpha [Psychrilyobacter piezotolerans]